MSKLTGSKKATQFTESVIREMTRLNGLLGGVNLSQGFPDFAAPTVVKEAACRGHPGGREPVPPSPGARKRSARRWRASSPAATVSPWCRPAGDGDLRLDRSDDGHHDGHHRSWRRSGHLRAVLRKLRSRCDPLRRHASLRHTPRARLDVDPDELAAAFNNRTKAIILNTPNNPTGKVFSREELEAIATLCRKWDVVGDLGRDLRAHPLRRHASRADREKNYLDGMDGARSPSPTVCRRPTASPDGASAGPSRRPH